MKKVIIYIFSILVLAFAVFGLSMAEESKTILLENYGGLMENEMSGILNPETSIIYYINFVVKVAIGLGSLWAVVLLIWGATLLLTKGDAASARDEAKKKIFAGLGGIVILAATFLLLQRFDPDVFNFKMDTPEIKKIKLTKNLKMEEAALSSEYHSGIGFLGSIHADLSKWSVEKKLGDDKMLSPVSDKAHISQNFNDTITNGKQHGAIDFAGSGEVKASLDGFVVWNGPIGNIGNAQNQENICYSKENNTIQCINNCGYGNTVIIYSSKKRIAILYAHLQNIDENIKVGDKISRGDKIGNIGNTGCSTGNHLHFETRECGDEIGLSVMNGSPSVFKGCTAFDPKDLLK